MRKELAKSKRSDAEKAATHYLHEVCHCDPEQVRRAIRTRYQKQDFWACDVMGRTKRREVFFVQVTAGQNEAVRQRRRKLEKIYWTPQEHVLVLQLVERQNPANARRKEFFFRVHRLDVVNLTWTVDETATEVPSSWFKKLSL